MKDNATQKEKRVKVEASSGLSCEEVDLMVEEATKMSEKDKEKSKQIQWCFKHFKKTLVT